MRFGIGAGGVALIVAAALAVSLAIRPAPVVDTAFLIEEAIERGFVAPEDVAALRDQLGRAQADLAAVRADRPDARAEIDRAVSALNAGDRAAAAAAFAEAGSRIEASVEAQRLELARLRNAEATFLYPFEASKAEPLLCEAAALAETETWFWIDCGRARAETGDLDGADAAFETALGLAPAGSRDRGAVLADIGDVRAAQGDLPGALAAYAESLRLARDLAARDPGNAGWARDVSVSLNKLGDVRVAQGDLPGALAAYEEDLRIARDLAARDPGNADWARDVVVSYWKLAVADPANAAAHWAEVVARMEAMAARGVLLPTDAPILDAARANLTAARDAH